MRTCTIDGCEKRHNANGLCGMHYMRAKIHGDPLADVQPQGQAQSFLQSVLAGTAPREPNGCILWPFSEWRGYGRIRHQGRPVHVGVLVLEHFVGPRPSERHTMGHAPHSVCGHRGCVAPEHLSWQTWAEQVAQQELDGTKSQPPCLTGEQHRHAVPVAVVREAVSRVHAGESHADVARALGVSRPAVSSWVSGRKRQDAFEEVGTNA